MDRRYRVLLIAEAANPEWASVPLIGWKLSRALADVAETHLVTQVRNRDAIVRTGLVEEKEFTAIDNERIAAPIYRVAQKLRGGADKGWTTNTAFSSLVYYSFEFELWRQFRKRLAAHEFDLVHRITPVSPTSQSFLPSRLSSLEIPFVVGPLNGGVPWPKNFTDRQYAEWEWLSHVRGLYKCMPYYRSMRRLSAAIITGSKSAYEDMPRWAQAKCVLIPENGVDAQCLSLSRNRSVSSPLRCAFIGRLVPYKGADILLDAAVDFLKTERLQVHIVGDGPQRPVLEAMVVRLGIQSSVEFHGWLKHRDALDRLGKCDFMALPSIREFGGGVVVESMALGVPPIVADYAGPSELVDDATGFRVPFRDRRSLIEGMKIAISRIIDAPQMLDGLGRAARNKVREKLTWNAKAQQICKVYDAVMSGAKDLHYIEV